MNTNSYSAARAGIHSGDLLAWSHYDWATWYDLQVQAVRIGTQSEYCHVGIALEFGARLWCLESVEPVVRMVPLSNLVGAHGFYHVPVGVPMSEPELEFALAKVGTARYSKVQAVKAQLGVLEIGADNVFQCAEYWITCRRLSGVDGGAKATPAALVQHMQRTLGAPVRLVMPDTAEAA